MYKHTPRSVIENFKGDRLSKANNHKEKYELKLNFYFEGGM